MGFPFWFRLLNVALCVFVLALCVLKLAWTDPDKARAARIAGLGFLTVVLGWIFYDMRYEPFHIRIPFATVGLVLAAYGLNAMSTEPEVFRQKKD